jgi:hypothetical protein
MRAGGRDGKPRPFGRLLRLFAGAAGWHPPSTAPFNRDVEARVAGERGARVLPFPCRQTANGWINADLGVRVELELLAWRPWPE